MRQQAIVTDLNKEFDKNNKDLSYWEAIETSPKEFGHEIQAYNAYTNSIFLVWWSKFKRPKHLGGPVFREEWSFASPVNARCGLYDPDLTHWKPIPKEIIDKYA